MVAASEEEKCFGTKDRRGQERADAAASSVAAAGNCCAYLWQRVEPSHDAGRQRDWICWRTKKKTTMRRMEEKRERKPVQRPERHPAAGQRTTAGDEEWEDVSPDSEQDATTCRRQAGARAFRSRVRTVTRRPSDPGTRETTSVTLTTALTTQIELRPSF